MPLESWILAQVTCKMGLVVSALSPVDVWLYHRKQAWIWYVLDAWQFLLRGISGLKLWRSKRGQDGHMLTSARGDAAQHRSPPDHRGLDPQTELGAWLPLDPGAYISIKTWASLSLSFLSVGVLQVLPFRTCLSKIMLSVTFLPKLAIQTAAFSVCFREDYYESYEQKYFICL